MNTKSKVLKHLIYVRVGRQMSCYLSLSQERLLLERSVRPCHCIRRKHPEVVDSDLFGASISKRQVTFGWSVFKVKEIQQICRGAVLGGSKNKVLSAFGDSVRHATLVITKRLKHGLGVLNLALFQIELFQKNQQVSGYEITKPRNLRR